MKRAILIIVEFVFIAGIIIIVGLLGLGVIAGVMKDSIEKIETYATTHTEFALSEVLDFEWDVAYNELNYYGRGEDVKNCPGTNLK